jgi:hypothetical protein
MSIPNLYQANSLHQSSKLVSSQRMDDEKPRSIRFPQWLWDEIDRDAQAARRSSVKQMEVVLTSYYRGEQHNVDMSRIEKAKGEKPAKPKQHPRYPKFEPNSKTDIPEHVQKRKRKAS